MAKITFNEQSAFFKKLQELEKHFDTEKTMKHAVYVGAGIVADEIRKNIENLPEEPFRHLDDETFQGVPTGQKRDLEESFGLTPIERGKDGLLHTHAGFDGYGSYPTKDYPKGLPNRLVARAIESGSSVRRKIPFIRPAVKASQEEAIKAMGEVIDEACKKIIEK